MTDKHEIRRRMRNRKQLLSDQERLDAASRVFDALERTAAFLLADRIMIYHSLPDELSTLRFLRKWAGRKQFFLPRVHGVNLELLPYIPDETAPGAYGIEEPLGDEVADPATMEMIVVPSMALDRRGNRVGRGKGFYDRLLPLTRATTVGVGYDFQLIDDFEPDPMDSPLDFVITETHTIRCIRR